MADKPVRHVVVFRRYFWDFYDAQTGAVQKKIDYVFDLLRTLPQVPEKFLKHLEGTDGLYEIRVEVGSNIFRVFCFFDEGKLVVLLNGFQKKTNRTPKQEISRALRLKDEYDEAKRTA